MPTPQPWIYTIPRARRRDIARATNRMEATVRLIRSRGPDWIERHRPRIAGAFSRGNLTLVMAGFGEERFRMRSLRLMMHVYAGMANMLCEE